MDDFLAIDPGTKLCGVVRWQGDAPLWMANMEPDELLWGHRGTLAYPYGAKRVLIEQIAHYGTGMPAGRDVFDTCRFIGQLVQAALERHPALNRNAVSLILRTPVKVILCGSARAKDANIAQAVRDKLGPPPTKATPNPAYGPDRPSKHAWQALGLALYWRNPERRLI